MPILTYFISPLQTDRLVIYDDKIIYNPMVHSGQQVYQYSSVDNNCLSLHNGPGLDPQRMRIQKADFQCYNKKGLVSETNTFTGGDFHSLRNNS